MSFYRVHTTAVKAASLNAVSTLSTVACDRDAVIESCNISSRAGITPHAANFSTVTILNGSKELFKRDFDSAGDAGISALTNEVLTPLSDTTVTKSTCLNVRYNYAGSGLAVDLDIVLVFRPSR